MTEIFSQHPSTAATEAVGSQSFRCGSLRIGHARAVVQYRLAVYPPGTTDRDRRLLRIWHACPMWAMACWLMIWTATLALAMPGPQCLAVAAIGTACLIAWSAASASPGRQQVRWMIVCVDNDEDHTAILRRNHLLEIAARMCTADSDLHDGRIDAVAHESIWSQCYATLA